MDVLGMCVVTTPLRGFRFVAGKASLGSKARHRSDIGATSERHRGSIVAEVHLLTVSEAAIFILPQPPSICCHEVLDMMLKGFVPQSTGLEEVAHVHKLFGVDIFIGAWCLFFTAHIVLQG